MMGGVGRTARLGVLAQAQGVVSSDGGLGCNVGVGWGGCMRGGRGEGEFDVGEEMMMGADGVGGADPMRAYLMRSMGAAEKRGDKEGEGGKEEGDGMEDVGSDASSDESMSGDEGGGGGGSGEYSSSSGWREGDEEDEEGGEEDRLRELFMDAPGDPVPLSRYTRGGGGSAIRVWASRRDTGAERRLAEMIKTIQGGGVGKISVREGEGGRKQTHQEEVGVGGEEDVEVCEARLRGGFDEAMRRGGEGAAEAGRKLAVFLHQVLGTTPGSQPSILGHES